MPQFIRPWHEVAASFAWVVTQDHLQNKQNENDNITTK